MKKNIFVICLASLNFISAYAAPKLSTENSYPTSKLEKDFGSGYSINMNNLSDTKINNSAKRILDNIDRDNKLNGIQNDYILRSIQNFFDKIQVHITQNSKKSIESDWYYPSEEDNVSFKFFIYNFNEESNVDSTSFTVEIEQRNKENGKWSVSVKNYNLAQQVKDELIESARILYMFEK